MGAIHSHTMRSLVIFAILSLGNSHKYLVDVDETGIIKEIQFKEVGKGKDYDQGEDCFLSWQNINWGNMDDTVVEWVQKRFTEAYQLLHQLQHQPQNQIQHHLVTSTNTQAKYESEPYKSKIKRGTYW